MIPQMMQCLGILICGAVQEPTLPDIRLNHEAVLPPDVYLVKAHAVATKSFKIDHVYVGPAALKDQTFFAEIYVATWNNMQQRIVPPIAQGAMGIWWVKKDKGELVSVYGQLFEPVWDRMVFVPALKDGTEDGQIKYDMAVAKAEVFEKIYHADDKDRLKVINDYVRKHDSVRGASALMLLLRGNNPKEVPQSEGKPIHERWRVEKNPSIADYVLPFAKDESLSPRVQWEVEQLLFLNKEGWEGSPDERNMFSHWFVGTWKEKENVPWEASEEKVLVEFFHSRLLSISGRLELAVGGLANATRSERFKAELIRVLQATEKAPRRLSPKEEAAGFAFLVRVIREDGARSRRVAAAKLLVVFAPLSAEHRAILGRLQGEALDDDIRKEMRMLLEK